MPNRLFQGIINQMRDATDRIIGVVDESGTVISCSELGLIGEIRKGVIAAGVSTAHRFVLIPAHTRHSATAFIRNMLFLLTAQTK